MDTVSSKLTVMFEEPFWIGLYEREYGRRYEVCKITFGPEPKDYEVYAFLLDNRQRLVFSPPIAAEKTKEKRITPKRMQRQISRQLASYEGIGTKAQQALKLQHEEGKQARKKRTKEEKDAEAERRFEQRQQKRKDKHNGH